MSLLVSADSPLEGTGLADQPQRYATSGTTSSQTVVAYPYTGDYRIDTLLEGAPGQTGLGALDYRWNVAAAVGSQTQVTYSFMSAAPYYGGTNEGTDTGFQPFNAAQQAAVRDIMGKLSQELGITLVERTLDTASSYGQIRFGNNYQETSSGYSWLPYSTPDDRGGDVWLDIWTTPNLTDLAPGGIGYGTLLHEIGHALGLKHPGDYNAGSGSSGMPGNYLSSAEDNETYTVMSYTAAPSGGQQRDWYGLYDLLALKTLYGSRSYNPGDTVYSYTDASGRLLKIIDDGAGFDTIDISGVSSAGNRVIDMRPGAFSSVGVLSGNTKAVKNLSIDFSTIVEKFVGTPYADSVTGNQANNLFVLGLGANTADGGGGIDTVQYGASRGSYTVSGNASSLQVSGSNVSDTLSNVERLAFTDDKLAFDLSGNAGIAAKILGAVFDAPAIANAGYAGIGLSFLDAGTSYQDLMTFALDARLGGARSNAQVVDLLYTNVAGVAPTADQAAPYVAQLNSGALSQGALGVVAAETAENAAQINLVGLAQTGLAYA